MDDQEGRLDRDRSRSVTHLDWYLSETGHDITATDIMIDALVRLDITSYDELVRLSGRVEALAAVRPYRRIDMQGVNLDLRKRLNIKSNGVDALLWTYLFAGLHSVSSENMIGEIKEGGGVGTFKDCLYKDASPDFCLSISHLFTEALTDIVNPEYTSIWTHHQSYGDPYCRFIFVRKGDPLDAMDDLGSTKAFVPKFDLPEGQVKALSIWAATTFLNENTSAFLDLHGLERTKEVLGANAYHVGLETGKRLVAHNQESGWGVASIGKLILSLEDAFGQKNHRIASTDMEFKVEVTDCTQQQFCVEQCEQYERLFNGIVEGIDPGLEFVYEGMMGRGNAACHWTIRRTHGDH